MGRHSEEYRQYFPEKKYHNIILLVAQTVSYDISYDIMIFLSPKYAFYTKNGTHNLGVFATALRMCISCTGTFMSTFLQRVPHMELVSATRGTDLYHAWNSVVHYKSYTDAWLCVSCQQPLFGEKLCDPDQKRKQAWAQAWWQEPRCLRPPAITKHTWTALAQPILYILQQKYLLILKKCVTLYAML